MKKIKWKIQRALIRRKAKKEIEILRNRLDFIMLMQEWAKGADEKKKNVARAFLKS